MVVIALTLKASSPPDRTWARFYARRYSCLVIFFQLLGCASTQPERRGLATADVYDQPVERGDPERKAGRQVARPEAGRQAPNMTVEKEPCRFVRIPVLEASGVAYHPLRETLFIVSDNGQFVEMDLKFSVLQRFRLRGDLEGVAIHPVTGSLFLVAENQAIVHEYGLIARRVLRTIRIDTSSHDDFADGLVPNRGIEGIAIAETNDGDYQLFAVVESNPPRLVLLSADVSIETTARARARVAEDSSLDPIREESRIITSYDLGLRRLSDVCDDPTSRALIVISSKAHIAILFEPDGRMERSRTIPGNRPEGLCILPDETAILVQDTEPGGLWVCPDFLSQFEKSAVPPIANE